MLLDVWVQRSFSANMLVWRKWKRNWTQHATCAPIGIKQTHCVNQPASIGVGKSTSSGVSLSSGLSTVWVDGITWGEGKLQIHHSLIMFNCCISYISICKWDTSSNERESLRSAQSSSNSTRGQNLSYMDFVIRKVIPESSTSTVESSWRQE